MSTLAGNSGLTLVIVRSQREDLQVHYRNSDCSHSPNKSSLIARSTPKIPSYLPEVPHRALPTSTSMVFQFIVGNLSPVNYYMLDRRIKAITVVMYYQEIVLEDNFALNVLAFFAGLATWKQYSSPVKELDHIDGDILLVMDEQCRGAFSTLHSFHGSQDKKLRKCSIL